MAYWTWPLHAVYMYNTDFLACKKYYLTVDSLLVTLYKISKNVYCFEADILVSSSMNSVEYRFDCSFAPILSKCIMIYILNHAEVESIKNFKNWILESYCFVSGTNERDFYEHRPITFSKATAWDWKGSQRKNDSLCNASRGTWNTW